jgi:four helix bundle protein
MATFRRVDEIDAGQKARVLTKVVYELPVAVCSQRILHCEIRFVERQFRSWQTLPRALNETAQVEFVQFLAIAKGSSAEVPSHACVAFDQGLMTKNEFDELVLKTGEVARMIAA